MSKNNVVNFVETVAIPMKSYNDVCSVYKVITDGSYNCPEDDGDAVLEEFKFRFGSIAELALDLEDRLDELFEGCVDVDDCKDRLAEYFVWDEFK